MWICMDNISRFVVDNFIDTVKYQTADFYNYEKDL